MSLSPQRRSEQLPSPSQRQRSELLPSLSFDSTFSDGAATLNTLHTANGESDQDLESLSLLHQIFPDESMEDLKRLHEERLHKSATKREEEEEAQEAKATMKNSQRLLSPGGPYHYNMPDDFLRLPIQTAVRRYHEESGKWEYQLVQDLQNRVLVQLQHYGTSATRGGRPTTHQQHLESYYYYTQVLQRHAELGLGITLTETGGQVRIYAINVNKAVAGEMMQVGDILVGVNGYPLIEIAVKVQGPSLLRHTVAFLKTCPSPVVLHLQKPTKLKPSSDLVVPNSTVSLLDTTLDESVLQLDDEKSFDLKPKHRQHSSQEVEETSIVIHPFAAVLSTHGFLTRQEEELEITQALRQFTERSRQWEFSNSFRIDAKTFELLTSFQEEETAALALPSTVVHQQPYNSPPRNNNNNNNNSRHSHYNDASSPARSATSTVASSISMSSTTSTSRSNSFYPGMRGFFSAGHTANNNHNHNNDIFIPLMGVRKALSVRILNTFLDGNYMAYTIWVHDIECGREWYAPLRYFRDFQDLRAAAIQLRPSISTIAFPSCQNGWRSPLSSIFGGVIGSASGSSGEANDSDVVRETKCRQLEYFLRTLCTMIYTEELHPAVAEISIHVQSFLGCDGALDSTTTPTTTNHPGAGGSSGVDDFSSFSFLQHHSIDGVHHTLDQWRLRTHLKRKLQMFTYRVFLLEAMGKLVDHFVDTARANGPSLKEIEVMQAKSRNSLKKHAMEELKRIQAVMDRLQELVLEGFMDDFRIMAQHNRYVGLQEFMSGKGGESYLERLVREAVREQVEIEVYLPLRGTTSRLLVNAWRHEDMEVSFKVQELRKRPQDYFRIPVEDNENWNSVSGLLKNVSMSTLPCAKLRAIVDAATEISRLYRHEQTNNEDDENKKDDTDDEPKHLGADDFLPIFIFCVIRAEMDRPCALCALLRTLCDPINRMGEVGYYLASFEAAITHIREMDLSESKEEMFSFLSIPLSDGSFG